MAGLIDLTKTAFTSLTSAFLTRRPTVTGQLIVPAGTAIPNPGGQFITRTLTVTLPTNKMFYLTRIRFNGTGGLIDNRWYTLQFSPGGMYFVSPAQFYIILLTKRVGANITYTFKFVNNLNNAVVNLPQITIDAEARPLEFPWEA